MAYDERGGRGGGFRDRGRDGGFRSFQPYDVSDLNLKCADCSVEIKELPFKPMMSDDGTTPARPVYCRDCNTKRRQAFRR